MKVEVVIWKGMTTTMGPNDARHVLWAPGESSV